MGFSFLKSVKQYISEVPTAAGTTDIVGESIDCQDAVAIRWTVSLGTLTSGAVTSITIEGSNDNSSWTALTGLTRTVADTLDDRLIVVEDNSPKFRYYRSTVDRGTQNAVINLSLVDVYMGHVPVEQSSSHVGASTFASGVIA